MAQFSAAAPVLEALNAGALDVAFAGDAPVTFALAAGLPARTVAVMRVSGAGTAIVVPDRSPIRTPADLKDRTVGVNRGSIGHALVLAVAEAQGWRPDAVSIANLLPTEAKSAVSTGAVDAWSSWGVFVAQARLVDGYRIVAVGSQGCISGLSYIVMSFGRLLAYESLRRTNPRAGGGHYEVLGFGRCRTGRARRQYHALGRNADASLRVPRAVSPATIYRVLER